MAAQPPTPKTPVARRAYVQSLLEQGKTIDYAERCRIAQDWQCDQRSIARDLEALGVSRPPARTQVSPRNARGPWPILGQVSPGRLAHNRAIAVLRLLGRLEFVSSAWITRLIFPDQSPEAMRRTMQRLVQEHRVWRTTVTLNQLYPSAAGHGRRQPPPKSPYIYGLTPEGKALLEGLDVEASPQISAGLQCRDRRAPAVSQAQITHDLLVASWCASVIDAARRCPLLESILCQVEYVSARHGDGRERQRFDALLVLRFHRTPRPQTAPGWAIPWYDAEPTTEQHIVRRFALEVDRGTEPLRILLGKGLTYRELTETGHYTRTLGGPVLPVFLVPPGKRAAQIAREWQDAWPGGAGVISSFEKAAHGEWGTLWGQYLTFKDTPPKPLALLAGVVNSLEDWARLCESWVPGLPHEASGPPA
ncbi:MAG TPA: replication-relaxation family protein [Herpetosiphonaceae bacterium]